MNFNNYFLAIDSFSVQKCVDIYEGHIICSKNRDLFIIFYSQQEKIFCWSQGVLKCINLLNLWILILRYFDMESIDYKNAMRFIL